jgi:hypothetical protein
VDAKPFTSEELSKIEEICKSWFSFFIFFLERT